MKKIKIALVTDSFNKGGAEQATINLLQALSPQKYEIDFIICHNFKMKDQISLVDQIPSWVHVYDLQNLIKPLSYFKKQFWRYTKRVEVLRNGAAYIGVEAMEKYFKDQKYDFAFNIGEWVSPSFMCLGLNSELKCCIIHTDLAGIKRFDHQRFFYYNHLINYYLFVSQTALDNSVKKYPFIKKKAVLVHNLIDKKQILKQSHQIISDYRFDSNLPTLITIANLRPEKGHQRQVLVMDKLDQAGIKVNWLNIGAFARPDLLAKINHELESKTWRDRFILLGPRSNPYPYLAHATAMTLFSDYEAWPLSIAESLALGVPVIATKTAGACEQVIDGENGLLCDFEIEDIYSHVKKYLLDKSLQKSLRKNISLSHQGDGLERENEFEKFVLSNLRQENHKEGISLMGTNLIYVSTYSSELKSKLNQFLKNETNVKLLFYNWPDVEILKNFPELLVHDSQKLFTTKYFNQRLFETLLDSKIDWRHKILKFRLILSNRSIGKNETFKKYLWTELMTEVKNRGGKLVKL